MKRFLYEQLVEIKGIHIIIVKMKPVIIPAFCVRTYVRKSRRNHKSYAIIKEKRRYNDEQFIRYSESIRT